jgi:hypothetical protein
MSLTHEPWWTGEAMCLDCGYKWQAVWPDWAKGNLECPTCHEFKGLVSMVKLG